MIADAKPYRRLLVLAILMGIAFLGLAGWLAEIQVQQHERLRELSDSHLRRKSVRPARRGSITDARGTVLATSIPTRTICADPSLIFTQHALVARTLAPILELPPQQLLQQILPRIRTNAAGQWVTNAYVVLQHKASMDCWQQVTQAMARLDLGFGNRRLPSSLRLAVNALHTRAIFSTEDYLRQYPAGGLAAHVVGFVTSEEIDTGQGRAFKDAGVTGLEQTCDRILSGVHGWRTEYEDVAPRPGLNVVLTLDAGVQTIVEAELAEARSRFRALSACAVVVDPNTGDVLALANQPTFDPNEPGAHPEGYVNHAISDLAEPGSTFKIVTITTALDEGLLTLTDTVHCENGRWLYAKHYLHDHHPYGVLSYLAVVAKSSNIGTAKAAVRLGAGRLYHTITNFGFGRVTGLPLPAEMPGVIRPTNRWNGLSITRVPIGHEVSATPLQMVMAMAAVANGGRLYQPRLVDRLEDDEGRVIRRFPTNMVGRVAGAAACREMVRALKTVVSTEGTARAARLDYYTVAGKTGTAEKFVNGTYKSEKYYASFIGFFPADAPRLCMIVAVDEPDPRVAHLGGAVAAPVFKAIATRVANYLRLPPDIFPEAEPEPSPRPRPEPAPELANRRAYAAAKP